MPLTNDCTAGADLVAAGTSCPNPGCGAVAIVYWLTNNDEPDTDEPWLFTCPRCGVDFLAPDDDLLFRAISGEWLRAGIHTA
jgi:hypothetical protein